MSEYPILFTGEMVRAILEGRKTQTRRIMEPFKIRTRFDVKSDPICALVSEPMVADRGVHPAKIHQKGAISAVCGDGRCLGVKPAEFDFICPYAEGETILENLGKPNSRWRILPRNSSLWVRETFRTHLCLHDEEQLFYRADGDEATGCPRCGERYRKWTPSIFMPRAASRITLELTGVRVERLQDIGRKAKDPAHTYGVLWDSINGQRAPWAKNPWVWVLEWKN